MSNPNPNKPNGNPDEIAIAQMRPVTPGCGMLHVGALDKVLTSRVKDQPGYADGYEITWVRQRRAFRVDHFRNNEPVDKPRWVSEFRVDEFVEA